MADRDDSHDDRPDLPELGTLVPNPPPARQVTAPEAAMSDPLPTRRRVFDLEGEAQRNADGANRQDELLGSAPGEPVQLLWEAGIGSEPCTVTVLSARGVPIGRLTEQYAMMLAPLLSQQRGYQAKLHCLRGGVPDYPRYGARISIAWDGQREHPHLPLDEEQLRFRRRKLHAAASWRRRAAGRIRRFAAEAATALGA